MAGLNLTILSPERTLLDECPVAEVTLTTTEGQIQILPHHAPMIAVLKTGVFRFTPVQGQPVIGVISSGFVEVSKDRVTVTAQTLETRDEINVERAKAAQKKAEDILGGPDLDEKRFNKYQLKLQRALIRQQIAAKEFNF